MQHTEKRGPCIFAYATWTTLQYRGLQSKDKIDAFHDQENKENVDILFILGIEYNDRKTSFSRLLALVSCDNNQNCERAVYRKPTHSDR